MNVKVPDFLSGYYCVFICNPRANRPYGIFATIGQAAVWKEEIHSKFPIITLAEWITDGEDN